MDSLVTHTNNKHGMPHRANTNKIAHPWHWVQSMCTVKRKHLRKQQRWESKQTTSIDACMVHRKGAACGESKRGAQMWCWLYCMFCDPDTSTWQRRHRPSYKMHAVVGYCITTCRTVQRCSSAYDTFAVLKLASCGSNFPVTSSNSAWPFVVGYAR